MLAPLSGYCLTMGDITGVPSRCSRGVRPPAYPQEHNADETGGVVKKHCGHISFLL